MSARYWVLMSDSLFHDGMTWPPGLRFAVSAEGADREPPASAHVPAASWRLLEDDDADPELDGRRVELVLHYIDGVPGIMTRSVRE